jgi:HPt (histidine-containing phosphotransfer) domain-containing protein
MNAPADAALISRLRMDLEIKAGVIKALRAERDHDSEIAREQAALLTAVSAELHAQATALGLVLGEREPSIVQRAVERLAALSADLADYMAATTGELVLASKPVHLRQLLSRFESRPAIELRVAANVAERVLGDQAALAKILSHFINKALETVGSGSLALEVTSSDPDGGTAPPLVRFTLIRESADDSVRKNTSAPAASASVRLRAALVRSLCEIMGATRTPESVSLPLQSATDQAHTGMFRLAVADAATVNCARELVLPGAKPSQPEALSSAQGAIDLLYLDRQLGSLAQVILARTAPAFIAQAQRRMTDLHVAHDIEDLKRLRTIAHAWKGSALSVGACELAALLDAIEKQAAVGRLPGAGPIWQLRSVLDRVVRALESYGDPDGERHERA